MEERIDSGNTPEQKQIYIEKFADTLQKVMPQLSKEEALEESKKVWEFFYTN